MKSTVIKPQAQAGDRDNHGGHGPVIRMIIASTVNGLQPLFFLSRREFYAGKASPGGGPTMVLLQAATLALAVTLLAGGCRPDERREPGGVAAVAQRPIAAVLADHTPRLMAVAGVAGTYQGALDDGSPCIAIMVVTLTPTLRDSLPKTLEGWPVRVEETGEIRPLGEGR
jgi:hypothetical protein